MASIYVVGTCDTKAQELRYVKDLIERAGQSAILVDVGTQSTDSAADVSAAEVARHHPGGSGEVLGLNDRGRAVSAMGEAFAHFVQTRVADIAGMIGMGGSGNTALVTQGMRALPIGTPKLMVSTVGSGNVAPYVGPSDLAIMYSVTDVAGINRISRTVLGNAAHALVGMVANRVPSPQAAEKPAIGLTMFGVTTPCVNQVIAALKERYDCLVFHATGTGGQSMEKLLDSGLVVGLIDTTTTEVCDFIIGGVFPCSADRFGAVARTRAPYVGSCGALDMVNFGARDTVPAQFKTRNLYVHNPQVTLMRTTVDENRRMGEWIGQKLNACDGPVRFLIPEGGVSMIDAPGKPFHDPAADAALFAALEQTVRQTEERRLIRLPCHINDPQFAEGLVANFEEIIHGDE
jgi:uncharacterized protein (UPF0261 family)